MFFLVSVCVSAVSTQDGSQSAIRRIGSHGIPERKPADTSPGEERRLMLPIRARLLSLLFQLLENNENQFLSLKRFYSERVYLV